MMLMSKENNPENVDKSDSGSINSGKSKGSESNQSPIEQSKSSNSLPSQTNLVENLSSPPDTNLARINATPNENKISKPENSTNFWSQIKSKFGKYCCCSCCVRNAKVHDSKQSPIDLSAPEKKVNMHRAVREATQKFEAKFWPNLWDRIIEAKVQNSFAVSIQRVVRGFLGRRKYKKMQHLALCDMNDYWALARYNKLLDKQKKMIEKLTRQKVNVILTFVLSN
jgi:hypothetical protein